MLAWTMKLLTEAEEKRIWVVLATVWASGSCLAWLAAALGEQPQGNSSGGLVLLICMVVGISLALRLPAFATKPRTTQLENHLVWLLCWIAMINWAGFVCLTNDTLYEAAPPLLILVLSELWLLRRALNHQSFVWLTLGWRKAATILRPLLSPLETMSAALSDEACQEASAMPRDQGVDVLVELTTEDVEGPEGWTRKIVDGHTEDGERFNSGEAHIEFEALQKSAIVLASFCPPFDRQPQVELEVESDCPEAGELSARVLRVTATGIRIEIKRKTTATHVFATLGWYAVEPTQAPRIGAVTTERHLP